MDARTAAYLAVSRYLQMGIFLEDTLSTLRPQMQKPDFRLAHEISYGTTRQALSLDFMATQLNQGKTISLKKKERALLRTALYQAAFMDRVPLYAIVDSTVSIAKNLLHPTIARFFNALLRKLEQGIPILPAGKTPKELSIRYSVPEQLVQDMIESFGIETTLSLLRMSNKAGPIFYRDRSKPVSTNSFLELISSSELEAIVSSDRFYIQNPTPIALTEFLAKNTPQIPRTVLDVCAAPGGKLLAVHDLYPEAKLFANDLTPEKLAQIEQNLKKFHIEATLSSGRGEHFPQTQLFDLVIVDAPCSNTGVLNKRPEARWRYQPESLAALENTQELLLQRALSLLAPGGCIWYMTCSIMPQENAQIVAKICAKNKLSCEQTLTILPDLKGNDGGFACVIKI